MGYSREDIDELSHEQLISKMKSKSLWNSEYADNVELLRTNMKLLLNRCMKQLRFKGKSIPNISIQSIHLEKIQRESQLPNMEKNIADLTFDGFVNKNSFLI